MFKYSLKRLGRSIFTLVIIIIIIFILTRQMPLEGYFPNIDKLTSEQIENTLKKLGLDQPIYIQIFNFFKNIITRGSLGVSYVYRNNVEVTTILGPKVIMSLRVEGLAMLLAIIIGLPFGIMMSKYKGGIFDKIGTLFIVIIQAVPMAVYYLFIQMYGTELFHLKLLFKEGEPATWILPICSLAITNIAYFAMWMRRYMVDQSTKDYVQLAKIKGLSNTQIMFRHVFKNAVVPLAQYLPTFFLNTIIGSIYIESLYGIPGMGGLLVDVVKKQDNTMVQAIVILFATVGIIGLIIGDIMMVTLDPRISFGEKEGSR